MKRFTCLLFINTLLIFITGCPKKHTIQSDGMRPQGGSGGSVTPVPMGGSGGNDSEDPEDPRFISAEAEKRFDFQSPYCVLGASEKESCGLSHASTLTPERIDTDHWRVQGCIGMSRPMRNSCGGSANTFEWIWKWEPEQDGFYTLHATHFRKDPLRDNRYLEDLSVSIREECDNIVSEILCENESQTIQINAQQGQTYFVLVEGKSSSVLGDVQLDIVRADASQAPTIESVDLAGSDSFHSRGYRVRIHGSDENGDVSRVHVRFYEEGQVEPISFGRPGDEDYDDEHGGYKWTDLEAFGQKTFVVESSTWVRAELKNAVRAEVELIDLQGNRSVPFEITPLRERVYDLEGGQPCDDYYNLCGPYTLHCDTVSQSPAQCALRHELPSPEISSLEVFRDGDRLTFHGEFRDPYHALTSFEVELFDEEGDELHLDSRPYRFDRFSLWDQLRPNEEGVYVINAQIRDEQVSNVKEVEFEIKSLAGRGTTVEIDEFAELPRQGQSEACDPERVLNLCENGFECVRQEQGFECQPNANPVMLYAALEHQPDLFRFGFSTRWQAQNGDEVGLLITWEDPEDRKIERVIPFDFQVESVNGTRQGVATYDHTGREYGFSDFVPNTFQVAVVDVYGRKSEFMEVSPPPNRPQIPEGPEVCDPRLVVSICDIGLGCVDPEGDGEFRCAGGGFFQQLENLRATFHRDTEIYDSMGGHSATGRVGEGSFAHRIGFEFEHTSWEASPIGLEFRLRNADEIITNNEYIFKNLISFDRTVQIDEAARRFRTRAHVLLNREQFLEANNLSALNGHGFELTFTDVDVRVVFAETPPGSWTSAPVVFAEEQSVGQSCDVERALDYCDEETFCIEQEPSSFVCASRENFSECPDDWVTWNLNDFEVAHSVLPDMPAWEHTGNMTHAPTYADASCGGNEFAVNRVYSFTAPEEGTYAFRLDENLEGTFLFARSHCGFKDRELFCESRCDGQHLVGEDFEYRCDGYETVPEGSISAGQMLEMEANQTIYLFVSTEFRFLRYRGLYNLRVEKFQSSSIVSDNPETRAWLNRETGQVTLELLALPSSFAETNTLSLQVLPRVGDSPVESQSPRVVPANFELIDGALQVVSHFILPLPFESLEQINGMEVWIEERGARNDSVILPVREPEVVAQNQLCDPVGAKNQCVDGLVCFSPNENNCGDLDGPFPEDQEPICLPPTELCPAVECPADWDVTSLNDFQQGDEWRFVLEEETDWPDDLPFDANKGNAACFPLSFEPGRADIHRFEAPSSGRYRVILETPDDFNFTLVDWAWAKNRCAFLDPQYDLSCQQGLLQRRESKQIELDLIRDQTVFLFVRQSNGSRDPYSLTLTRLE